MNKISILTAYQMLQQQQKSPTLGPYTAYNDYLAYLQSKGISLNPKLQPSVFKLKNGLPYIGMAAKATVEGAEVLIRVPEELILSSAKAAQEPLLSEVFKDKFFLSENQSWQDRVLIVYCLFLLHQKDESNPWYQMVRRFPKQCDIACFWSQQELNNFKDKIMRRSAQMDKKGFEEEWAQFEQLQSKHDILQFQQFNRQNYKTIFMTQINRAFGASLSFVSLVPFAELFNHHCTTVFYGTEKTEQTYFKDQAELTDGEEESVGSCESEQYIEQGEFSYDRLDAIPYNWEVQQSFKLNKKQQQIVQKQVKQLLASIENDLNWQDFTIKVVGPLIFKIKVVKKQYLVGRKPYTKAKEELNTIRNSIELYRNSVVKYYSRVNKKSYWGKPEKKQESKVQFKYPQVKKQFQNLIIKTGKSDRFQPNNQIYFRYGHNSNRTLLLHYGFAIEGNKYEHCWLTFNLTQYLIEFPDVIDNVMDKHLSLLRKFKIYNHRLNIDLIIFFRLNNWLFYGEKAIEEIFHVMNTSKEIKILKQIVEILQQKAKTYEGEYDLTDSYLNYHQYFIAVYHLQKLTIFRKQIHLLNQLINILMKMDEGSNLESATDCLTNSQRAILEPYLITIKI